MSNHAKELLDLGSKLFDTKRLYDSLCQEIALNIYPERADFIVPIVLGQEFAAHLAESFPVLARRELGNSLSATLRPRDRAWFQFTTLNERIDNDPVNARYLEYLTRTTRMAIYDARTKFIRATKEGDHDFITFGQPVISVEESPDRDHIFYRCHHIRDCAWLENEIGEIDHLHRKDKMTARQMTRKFRPDELHEKVKRAAEKEPDKEFNIRVVALPASEYDLIGKGKPGKDSPRRKFPFVLVYIDQDHAKIMREAGIAEFPYIVPRWSTISGYQYAFSPAVMTSLPDVRMAQALAAIMLEAGEKQINPPIVARDEVIRDANLQAGAITWADAEFDGKISDHFMPVDLGADMRTAFTMQASLRETLNRAFFIDKLKLPEAGKQMTAYEISQRLEEHVRNLLPLFEPMEVEYNTKLLDKSFAVLRNMGTYDWSAIPDDLKGADISWRFRNPMQQVSDRILVQQFQEAMQLEMAAMQAGVSTPRLAMAKARDDALRGTGIPAEWRRTDEELQAEAEQMQAAKQMQEMMAGLQGGAAVAKDVADASTAVGQAMELPAQQPQKALPSPKRAA